MNQRTEDILRLVCGVTTPAAVAAKHGVSAAEVEQWRADYVTALESLATRRPRRRLGAAALALVTVAAAGVGLYSTEAFAQACAQTLPSPMKTFCPGDPARASEVNANNTALVGYIQQKVGTVGNNNISTTGTASVGALTATSVNNTGNETLGGVVNFGNRTTQHLNLWGTQYGVGVQNATLYLRGDTFAWHSNGVHSNTQGDPGPGGTTQLTLDGAGNLEARGQLRGASLRSRNCYWGHAGVVNGVGGPVNQDNATHEAWCPDGQFMRGWRCYATTYLDGNCQAYCCTP